MSGLSNSEAGKIIGVTSDCLRRAKYLGLKPEGPAGKWSVRQVLALAVRINCRKAGATKAAADSAFRILSVANLDKLKQACSDGKKYLRLFDTVCDTNLVSRPVAFDPEVMKRATENRVPYIVADIAYWLDKMDAVQDAQNQREEKEKMKDESEMQLQCE